MNTIIECPYCRKPIPIIRRIAYGHEILNDVCCPHCKRSMDIEFDNISNLPYLLAYFGKLEELDSLQFTNLKKVISENGEILYLTGIRVKKSEEQKKQKAYQIRYHESSIDAVTNICYNQKFVLLIKCAQCGDYIHLNQEKDIKDVFGLFCDYCARKSTFRNSSEFLSEFYDAEQALLKEENENQESEKQEEKSMAIKSTIIGFVFEDKTTGEVKIYNPKNNHLATLSAAEFETLCLGEFPYRRVRVNKLTTGDVIEAIGGDAYYVMDSAKNQLLNFKTGAIESSAIKTNLLVATTSYIKLVPVLKKTYTLAEVTEGNLDPRVKKILETISNDIQTGNEDTNNNVVARMVRFYCERDKYENLLDMETLEEMVMSDPQALTCLTQRTNMEVTKAIAANNGVQPVALYKGKPQEEENSVGKKEGEDDETYKQRLTQLMEEAAKKQDYEMAAKYQKELKDIE